jgi:hypothetical protein
VKGRKQAAPNYRRLRKEGWVTNPKVLRLLIALNGLQVGDEIMHRQGHRLMPVAKLEKQEHVKNYIEYYREHGIYDPEYWHLLAWRRPHG